VLVPRTVLRLPWWAGDPARSEGTNRRRRPAHVTGQAETATTFARYQSVPRGEDDTAVEVSENLKENVRKKVPLLGTNRQ
jgi:hypothetical protein